MNYIGMDVHISSVDIAVVNCKGNIKGSVRVKLSIKEIIGYINGVPKPRRTFIEEGSLAGWLLENFTNLGEELVVSEPKRNKWISHSDEKSDANDAVKLAKLAWGNYMKEIHHPIGDRRQFKELVFSYHDTVKSATRIKNKIKAKFRQHGIECTGSTVYSQKNRAEWIAKHSDETALFIIEGLWRELDVLEEVKEMYLKRIKVQSKRYPEVKLLMTIPGIALIHAVTISAVMETPDRFSKRSQVWKYAGFGLARKTSGNSIYSLRLSKDYNRHFKNAIKKAVEIVIHLDDNPFKRKYIRLVMEAGMPQERAKMIVARSMITTIYYMWKRKEKFNPQIDLERSEGKAVNHSISLPL